MNSRNSRFRSKRMRAAFNLLGSGVVVVSVGVFIYVQINDHARDDNTQMSKHMGETIEPDSAVDSDQAPDQPTSDEQQAKIAESEQDGGADGTAKAKGSETGAETGKDEGAREGMADAEPGQGDGDLVARLQNMASDRSARGLGIGATFDGQNSYTLQEFADKVPLIAGKMKATLLPDSGDVRDPIVEVQFMSFFPNYAVNQTGKTAMPSLSLFAAKRNSGVIEKTRVINDYHVAKRLSSGEYANMGDVGRLFLPLTTCSALQMGNTLNVLLSFVGIGSENDFHVQMHCGSKVSGTMLVDNNTKEHARYRLDAIDYTTDGHEAMNFVVAGINPRREENIRWLELGKEPSMGLVNLNTPIDEGPWVSRWITRRNVHLHDLMVKERENASGSFLDTLGEDYPNDKMTRPVTPPRLRNDQNDEHARFIHPLDRKPDGLSSDAKTPRLSKKKTTPVNDDPTLTHATDVEQDLPALSRQNAGQEEVTVSQAEPEELRQEEHWENLIFSRALQAWDTATF